MTKNQYKHSKKNTKSKGTVFYYCISSHSHNEAFKTEPTKTNSHLIAFLTRPLAPDLREIQCEYFL